eukprot:6412856-Alexandrium_andersonii.AAC.1
MFSGAQGAGLPAQSHSCAAVLNVAMNSVTWLSGCNDVMQLVARTVRYDRVLDDTGKSVGRGTALRYLFHSFSLRCLRTLGQTPRTKLKH